MDALGDFLAAVSVLSDRSAVLGVPRGMVEVRIISDTGFRTIFGGVSRDMMTASRDARPDLPPGAFLWEGVVVRGKGRR